MVAYGIATRLGPHRTATRPASHRHEVLIAWPRDCNRKAFSIFRSCRHFLLIKTWRISRWMVKKQTLKFGNSILHDQPLKEEHCKCLVQQKSPSIEELFFLSAIAMAQHSVQIISPQPYEPLSCLGHRLSSRCRVP